MELAATAAADAQASLRRRLHLTTSTRRYYDPSLAQRSLAQEDEMIYIYIYTVLADLRCKLDAPVLTNVMINGAPITKSVIGSVIGFQAIYKPVIGRILA